jgi:hypothetical protein
VEFGRLFFYQQFRFDVPDLPGMVEGEFPQDFLARFAAW